MNIIASDLKNILSRLSIALTTKGIVQDADKFVFDMDKIYVFNGETFVCCQFETGLNGTVQGDSLLKYLDKVSNSEIEVEQDETKINIKKKRCVASFVAEQPIKLPIDLNEIDWKKAPENLNEAISVCQHSCGEDYTDLRTTCIHVFDTYAESSDRERITRFTLNKTVKDEFFIPITISSFLSRNKITHYYKNDEWLFFKNQNSDIICHRNVIFGEEYFALETVIKDCSKGNLIEFPEKMYDSIEKAAVFQSDIKIDSDRRVTVRCKKNKLKIESTGTYGNFSEVIKCDIEDNFTFAINPSFLLQVMEKSNNVYFDPAYIRIETDNYVFLTTLAAE